MMNGITLGGFNISGSTQMAILVVFVLYSVIVVGLGFFVKYNSRKGNAFSDFLTGGGGLNSLEVAMISATTIMGGGVMVSGPGLVYHDGFIYSLLCLLVFLASFVALGTYGKKLAIIQKRLHAQTVVQCIHHRYQSRGLTMLLVACMTIFMTMLAGGQFLSAAKVFGAILGHEAYTIGLIVSAVIILVYSLAGGFKSLAKVCVLQGMLMIFAVLFLAFAEYRELSAQFGSMQASMEFVARSKSALVDARTYTPLQALGMGIINAWANSANPANMQVAMTYDNTKTQMRSLPLSCLLVFGINLIMSTSGVFSFALNQNITNADYSTVYMATHLLPGWLAGVVIAAVFACIQSSVASFMILVAGSLTRDLYKDCINPAADDKKLNGLNLVLLAIVGVIAVLVAWNPGQLGQLLVMMATGGVCGCFAMISLFGTFWRKATTAGGYAACFSGFAVYVVLQLLSKYHAQFYNEVMHAIHPLIPALLISMILMVVVSLATQDRKVPLGVYRVWFCKDYDDKYTQIYNSCSLGWKGEAEQDVIIE